MADPKIFGSVVQFRPIDPDQHLFEDEIFWKGETETEARDIADAWIEAAQERDEFLVVQLEEWAPLREWADDRAIGEEKIERELERLSEN